MLCWHLKAAVEGRDGEAVADLSYSDFYLGTFQCKTWSCDLGAVSYQEESKTGIRQDKRIWKKQTTWLETIRTFGLVANKSFYRHETKDGQDVLDETAEILTERSFLNKTNTGNH